MTPAEHAAAASAWAENAGALLLDLTDGNRDERVVTAHAMAAVSEAHARAALVQRSVIAEQRRDALVASFRTLAPKETP
jgi:hypothetical protein